MRGTKKGASRERRERREEGGKGRCGSRSTRRFSSSYCHVSVLPLHSNDSITRSNYSQPTIRDGYVALTTRRWSLERGHSQAKAQSTGELTVPSFPLLLFFSSSLTILLTSELLFFFLTDMGMVVFRFCCRDFCCLRHGELFTPPALPASRRCCELTDPSSLFSSTFDHASTFFFASTASRLSSSLYA